MKRGLISVSASILLGHASMPPALGADGGYVVSGSGSPVVVLQAGFGDNKETWAQVVPELSRDFTVFAYDRPGTGGTAPTDAPRDPCSIAAELRERLHAAGLKPPYLLVGHSLGGLYQYVFAKLYSAEVAGFVLVDPTHPRNWEAVQSEQPEAAVLIKTLKLVAWSDVQRREFDEQTGCLDTLDVAHPLVQPGKVLISGRPQVQANEKYERKRQALGQEWRQFAGVRQVDIVWGSSHFIQKEQPGTIVAAVREVSGRVEATAPGLQPAGTVTLGNRPPIALTPGATSRQQVEDMLGKPEEILRDGAREVWVYSDRPPSVPWAISLLPIIGDVLDVVSMIQNARTLHELVLQFDEDGLIRSYVLRELNSGGAGS